MVSRVDSGWNTTDTRNYRSSSWRMLTAEQVSKSKCGIATSLASHLFADPRDVWRYFLTRRRKHFWAIELRLECVSNQHCIHTRMIFALFRAVSSIANRMEKRAEIKWMFIICLSCISISITSVQWEARIQYRQLAISNRWCMRWKKLFSALMYGRHFDRSAPLGEVNCGAEAMCNLDLSTTNRQNPFEWTRSNAHRPCAFVVFVRIGFIIASIWFSMKMNGVKSSFFADTRKSISPIRTEDTRRYPLWRPLAVFLFIFFLLSLRRLLGRSIFAISHSFRLESSRQMYSVVMCGMRTCFDARNPRHSPDSTRFFSSIAIECETRHRIERVRRTDGRAYIEMKDRTLFCDAKRKRRWWYELLTHLWHLWQSSVRRCLCTRSLHTYAFAIKIKFD